MDLKRLTEDVIGGAMEVHRALGPGLLESAYEMSLCRELALRELVFERQKALTHLPFSALSATSAVNFPDELS